MQFYLAFAGIFTINFLQLLGIVVYYLLPVKLPPPFNCLTLSFDHSNISASVMFLLKFLDICFRLLLYESISIPGSFQIPPHPPFLKGGLPTSIPF